MSCAVISCSRSADYPEQYLVGMDLTGYSPEFSISDSEGGTNRLALSSVATGNGSNIVLSETGESSVVTLLIKQADIVALPAGSPWVGVYQFRLVSPTSVRTVIETGSIEVRGAV